MKENRTQKIIRIPITYIFGKGYWPKATQDGIRLYYVNFAKWDRFGTGKIVKFLFLPHLKVKVKGFGFNWWMPLYFWGSEDFVHDLKALAPSDSSFHSILTSEESSTWNQISPGGLVVITAMTFIYLMLPIVFLANIGFLAYLVHLIYR